MATERLRTLAAAYGGDLARWPRADAEAALRSGAAEAALVREAVLDDLLDVAPKPLVSHALREQVLAAAPRPRASVVALTSKWLSGLGLAGACAAGLLVGLAAPATSGAEAGALALLAPYDPGVEIVG